MREGTRAGLSQWSGYGPLLLEHELVCKGGSRKCVTLVNLLSWLHGAYKAGGGWHGLLKQTMATHHGPLSLVFYSDEVTPGNVLANVPTRKLWAIYTSIKQFGLALQHEAAWITVGLIRSDIVSSLDGHLSQVFSALLLSIFNNPFCNVLDLGLQLQEPEGSLAPGRLCLQLGFMIMDGQAAKFCWSRNGDSGSRFCQQCANIFQMAADNDEDEDVDVNLSEVSRFCKFNELHLASENEIFHSWDRMSERFSKISDKEFRLWEQASGISYSKFALLGNVELRSVLRPTQQNCWDWMHCLLSSGVMNLACYNLCQEIKQWDLLKSYVQLFQLPSHLGNIRLAPLFDLKSPAHYLLATLSN